MDSSNEESLFSEKDSKHTTSKDSKSSPEPDDELSVLNRTPACCCPLPKLEPTEHHTVLISTDIQLGETPRPSPSSYTDKWDSDHVRMPCSPLNIYLVGYNKGDKKTESRWDLICRSLRAKIESSEELEAAIMKYNSEYKDKWDFQLLHTLINKHWSDEEKKHFFEVLLPAMIEITLDLPNICTQPLPLLKKETDHYLTMSQKQIGCLLLNAFFCTFPERTVPSTKKQKMTFEYANFPDINFNSLFADVKRESHRRRKTEKLKCFFNYFQRIVLKEPTGTVTFHRQTIRNDKEPNWSESSQSLRTAVIKSQGVIEEDGQGMLQVDFADKFIGGWILIHGCVQEEIRFSISPELIVSRLFIECLGEKDSLIVTGFERYNKYSGYADSFRWEGDFKDQTPVDSWGRRYCELVAIDAKPFRKSSDQYKHEFLSREINKAYSGFYEKTPPAHLPAVATGNWGCGAFKGSVHLKFLLQLMAASEAGRSLAYFTFGNEKTKNDMIKMYNFLRDNNVTVGDLWKVLILHSDNMTSDLYSFIYSQFGSRK